MDYLHDKLYKGILITYIAWNIGPSLCNKIHQIKDITLMSNLVAVESKNTGYKKNSSFLIITGLRFCCTWFCIEN